MTRAVARLSLDGGGTSAQDSVCVEEPLELRLSGETLAVTMRTPGHDRELLLGFAFAEGLISALDQVGSIFHCGRPDDDAFGNTIELSAAPGVALDPDAIGLARRSTDTSAACGVCGRRSIEDLLERCTPLPVGPVLSADLLDAAARALAAHQPLFDATGGSHCAVALDGAGRVLAAFEDVGRHNAVDKVLGRLLLDAQLPRPDGAGAAVLFVSGRCSFEIVQKAAVAAIPVVGAVSAPTSLAAELAERVGLCLAGFVRGGRATVYAHAERLAG